MEAAAICMVGKEKPQQIQQRVRTKTGSWEGWFFTAIKGLPRRHEDTKGMGRRVNQCYFRPLLPKGKGASDSDLRRTTAGGGCACGDQAVSHHCRHVVRIAVSISLVN